MSDIEEDDDFTPEALNKLGSDNLDFLDRWYASRGIVSERAKLKAELATERAAREAAERERDEARERAETLPADFDSDCWRALRSLLNECNFDWRDLDPDGITADQAEEHISTTLDELEKGEAHWKARAEKAEAETARKCADIADMHDHRGDIAAAIRAAFNLEQKP